MRGESATAKSLHVDDPSDTLERRIAGVAHELRTPLNGLLTLAEQLLQTPLSTTQRGHVEAMRAAAIHLNAVASDVLEVGRLQDAKPHLENRAIDLGEFFSGIGAPLAARAAAQGVVFEIDIAPDVPRRVTGDLVRLRQMVENLADNALKVTDRGEVRVVVNAAPAVTLGCVRLTVMVIDTGPGLGTVESDALFAPYAQGVHARGGAGLGLALVRGFAEAMRGTAFAADRPQGGAAVGFTVELEALVASEEAEGKAAAPKAPVRRKGPLRILVAEDNPVNRVVIGTILDQFGHSHDMVFNGSAAVAAVSRGDYDLVLMDKKMPVLDGLAATRAIRALATRGGTIPVIGVTAGVFKHEIEEFHAAGAEAVVTKPISVRALWQAIEEALAAARRAA